MPVRLVFALGCAVVCQLALPAGPAGAEAVTESDQIVMGMAEAACQAGDYRGLFDAIARSEAVRRKYTAAHVEHSALRAGKVQSTRQVAAADYADFPVALRDYTYVPVPALAGNDPEMALMVEFNQAPDGRVAVDWTRIHYLPPQGDDAEVGAPVHLDGSPWVSGDPADGTLLLYPTATCFELVADTRYLAP